MEPPDSLPSPPPDWLTLPDNVSVAIFDFLNPGTLLSLRQVCTQWQRLAEASAQTRDKLILMQCGCEDKDNCDCSMKLMRSTWPGRFFSGQGLNADGTKHDKRADGHLALHLKVNAIRCGSFDWKKAQLLVRLFPRIGHFTVSHNSICIGHLDQIIYLLTQWSPTLTAFKFHSDYSLESPDPLYQIADVIDHTLAFLDIYQTRLFAQLNSLPALKHLTLHYLKGQINSTIGDFAFLPRLEELHLDRTSLEDNLLAACQRYFASPPELVLRHFTHNVKQFDSSASAFAHYLQYSPEALPLAAATNWYHQLPLHSIGHLGDFLHRFPFLDMLVISHLPPITLAPLSRSLASHNVAYLCLRMEGIPAGEEDALEDMVPVPSVRGLTIVLNSPDHDRIYPFLAQIPTVFPRLSSLLLYDCRSQVSNAPSGTPFSTTADESRGFARLVADLLAAYPPERQPVKYQQVNSFLHLVRHINSTFPSLNRTFVFKGQPGHLRIRPMNQQ